MDQYVNLEHLRSQYRGCLLGGAVGDALGMPTEEGPSRPPGQTIRQACGVDRVEEYLDSPSTGFLEAGQYTDDTQQTICLAETLLESDGQFHARRFFDRLSAAVKGKMRGVGPSTVRVLGALSDGLVEELLDGQLASGSPSNGGAMRVAPLALLWHHDIQRLRQEVVRATSATHRHPRAMAGACAQAFLIASRVGRPPEQFDPENLRCPLVALVAPLDAGLADMLASPGSVAPGRTCRVEDTVPPVVEAFLRAPASWSDAVLEQVNSDGDTDTKASMLGSALGAHHGVEAIPARWIDGLENGHKGRDYLFLLADALLLQWLRLANMGRGLDQGQAT